MEKRKFYDKDFTRKMLFEAVIEMANAMAAEGVDTEIDLDKVIAGMNYELESLELQKVKNKKDPSEKKDPLSSKYAQDIVTAIVPLLDGTPKTADELVEMATAQGKVSEKGTPFAKLWVSRVLNNTPGVTKVQVKMEKVDAKGLKAEVERSAYVRG